MLELLRELERRKTCYKDRLSFKAHYNENNFSGEEYRKEIEIERKIEDAMINLHLMDRQMKLLIPNSLWSDDSVIRAKRLATGVYDEYIDCFPLFEKCKSIAKLILRLF